ncbi:CLUMA_CG001929, isoform A [Clunio marinus]|uniref:CLUMA_CG001929, isoform A n=1 Tax=Clunio marinus TaxID=568069 RepID=A0A1J1HJC0_9DIPT|nr:CLUMA_CG001929, isoform A [Clunio marinus]
MERNVDRYFFFHIVNHVISIRNFKNIIICSKLVAIFTGNQLQMGAEQMEKKKYKKPFVALSITMGMNKFSSVSYINT